MHYLTSLFALVLFVAVSAVAALNVEEQPLWVTYEGGAGPGQGKHIVLIAGDEEYRSEEALPQLGKILARRHGFKCTVLFPIDPETGEIHPNISNIPGLEALKDADLMVIATRFRNLPDEQMRHIDDYVKSGRPIIGLRTATHAFKIPGDRQYAKYNWNNPDGGFGRVVLGETWVAHHGHHGKEATRGILVEDQKNHPILRGIKDGEIFGPTDVYTVKLPLPGDSQPLVLGEVVAGMDYDDPAVEGKKNDPMMPVAWTKTYSWDGGKTGRVFTTTMGAAEDLSYEGTRRLLVNAAYWAVGLEDKIPASSNVDLVGEFKPTKYKFDGFKKGVKPSDHAMESGGVTR